MVFLHMKKATQAGKNNEGRSVHNISFKNLKNIMVILNFDFELDARKLLS